MKVQNNICEGSLITNYLPADYCDSFSKTIVSDKVVTPEVLTILLLPFHKTIMRSILNRVAKQMK